MYARVRVSQEYYQSVLRRKVEERNVLLGFLPSGCGRLTGSSLLPQLSIIQTTRNLNIPNTRPDTGTITNTRLETQTQTTQPLIGTEKFSIGIII